MEFIDLENLNRRLSQIKQDFQSKSSFNESCEAGKYEIGGKGSVGRQTAIEFDCAASLSKCRIRLADN